MDHGSWLMEEGANHGKTQTRKTQGGKWIMEDGLTEDGGCNHEGHERFACFAKEHKGKPRKLY